MPTQECKCGARYRFPESAIGKRAKCQKCGTLLTLEAEADQGVLAIADEPAAPQPTAPVSAACLPSAESPGRIGHVVVEEAAEPPTYAGALLRTLLFPTALANFLTFVFICALIFISVALLPFGGCAGTVGQVIVVGWYTTFRFSVIEGAAAGEKELPTLALTNGAFDDIIAPLFKWLGSWAVVLSPAFVSLIVMWHLGLISPSSVIRPALQGVGGILAYATSDMIVFTSLVYAGMALWPMIVLCVALGGFDCLTRPDLIIATLSRTLPIYLATVGIVFGPAWLVGQILTRPPTGSSPDVTGYLIRGLVAASLGTYFEIVAMRAIGLYYHHFKQHFAWSWD